MRYSRAAGYSVDLYAAFASYAAFSILAKITDFRGTPN